MKFSVHTLYWPNINTDIVDCHKKNMQYFDIDIKYYNLTINHGKWMDQIVTESKDDVIIFIDIDAVIINKQIFNDAIEYAITKESFIGPAQVSNHIKPAKHIFAAPSFFFISRKCLEHLNYPSFSNNRRSDIAENISYVAESKQKTYKYWYPKRYEKNRTVYRLADYGNYGTGTVYEDSLYHLYQSRKNIHNKLFKYRCDQILNNSFDFSDMKNSVSVLERSELPFL